MLGAPITQREEYQIGRNLTFSPRLGKSPAVSVLCLADDHRSHLPGVIAPKFDGRREVLSNTAFLMGALDFEKNRVKRPRLL
jgi:hypothetical protein